MPVAYANLSALRAAWQYIDKGVRFRGRATRLISEQTILDFLNLCVELKLLYL